ncbi:MAG: hypothetical protein EZS28_014262, partial [Streblomastix strix]
MGWPFQKLQKKECNTNPISPANVRQTGTHIKHRTTQILQRKTRCRSLHSRNRRLRTHSARTWRWTSWILTKQQQHKKRYAKRDISSTGALGQTPRIRYVENQFLRRRTVRRASGRSQTTRKSSHGLGNAQKTAETQQPTSATDARLQS